MNDLGDKLVEALSEADQYQLSGTLVFQASWIKRGSEVSHNRRTRGEFPGPAYALSNYLSAYHAGGPLRAIKRLLEDRK